MLVRHLRSRCAKRPLLRECALVLSHTFLASAIWREAEVFPKRRGNRKIVLERRLLTCARLAHIQHPAADALEAGSRADIRHHGITEHGSRLRAGKTQRSKINILDSGKAELKLGLTPRRALVAV